MIKKYKHLADSIKESTEKQFISLADKNLIKNNKDNMVSLESNLTLKIGDKADVSHTHHEYAIKTDTHTKAEVEALIDNIVQTDLTNHYNKQEVDNKLLLKANQETTYTKEEVDTIIGTIEPPAESTHVHENITVVNSLGDSANMLTYKGKVVVNSNEYSFKTLPIKKPKSQMTKQEIEGRKLPWLT